METKTTEQRGITMHTETLRMCTRRLTESEIGALIRTILHDYYPDEYPESTDRLVLSQADNLRDNIARNQSKYTTRKERNAEYWERYNKTRKQRERNKLLQELQGLQGVTIAPEVLQELTSEDTDIISNTKGTLNNTISKPKPKSKSKPNPNTNPNEVNNNTSNNEDINPNISNSNKIKYTLPEVRKILEEKEIFFKKNWIMQFYHLNSVKFQWKYDPVSAAYAFINIHPESVKGGEKNGENTPPTSAAPPTETQQAAIAATEAELHRAAEELYSELWKEMGNYITQEDKETLGKYITTDIAWQKDIHTKCLRFHIDNRYESLEEVFPKVKAVMDKASELYKKYSIVLQYRPRRPVKLEGGGIKTS